MTKRKVITVIFHGLFWSLAFYILNNIIGFTSIENVMIINGKLSTSSVRTQQFSDVFKSWLLNMFLFYTNILILLPSFLKSTNLPRHLALITGLVIFSLWMDYAISSWINDFPLMGPGLGWPMFTLLIVYILFLGLSYAYFFINEWVKNEQLKHVMREEQLRTELSFLRFQIQPHFLFNALNNLFSMARETRHKELIEGISSLSQMMRYMLYDTNSEKVSLAQEVNYLENYINLHKLKYAVNDKINISFRKEGNLESAQVAPFILIPFVENAFKYGINLEAESIINISLLVNEQSIEFNISNTDFSYIHKTMKEKSGIGLENVKRRLLLLYPSQHSLDIDANGESFHVHLKLGRVV